MTTLVTGGNGWVPCHVVRRLARRGETVVSYDLMPPDDLLREFLGEAIDRVVFVAGDVTDRGRLGAVAHEYAVSEVIHAAVITPRVERERREPARIIEVNLGGTINALEVARALPSLRRFVYVSSGAVWGPQAPDATILSEESPANATSLYAIGKLASERICLRYGELFDLPVVAVRPSNVYGPMERVTPGYAGATELREMLRIHDSGQPILVNALEAGYRDWTYVEDVAEGIERAWEVGSPRHRVYTLSAGEHVSVGEVLAAFARYLPGLTFRQVPLAEANYPVDEEPPGPLPSAARAKRDLGWSAATSFDDGMRRYLGWIAAHGPQ